MSNSTFKTKTLFDDKDASKISKYAELVLGEKGILKLLRFELIILISNWVPGALGFFLRSKLYPLILGNVGRNVFFGRNITLRHPHKIRIGDNVVIDDNAVLDAKGSGNKGIFMENGVFVGRNTIIYCKNGDIYLKKRVNIGHNCIVFSSNKLTIGENTLLAAYSYCLSGGRYDYADREVRMIDQDGTDSAGELVIGAHCWIGAHAVILDGACMGNNSVLGAGAVLTKPIPENVVATGVPAIVSKKISP